MKKTASRWCIQDGHMHHKQKRKKKNKSWLKNKKVSYSFKFYFSKAIMIAAHLKMAKLYTMQSKK